ncbi:phosphoribosylformylglycinamidine synthase subunit PurQ [Neptunicoccus cionae]|uniref:Phosphoribosylformylglycinamidine synthase subunit PurQ n=1 Tax=Neptunicoccus cionae TaxID=2035344 RepID=A0A916R0C0_9RHOB|nr:phosphoribosylformylglycinamidine synthase subunit PurQ [Amylibacter cionae]GGA24332.1 phosphoribosylformylglycinamidine synthase subunit PurQ [Amylibacter cionae]
MRAAVIQFPGSNCDRDMAVALANVAGGAENVSMVWHKDAELPKGLDVIGIPGGFSFGDYLRCGAIAARSPIMDAVVEFANKGGYVFGLCNGFQILTESGLLPGVLMRNAGLKYICKDVELRVETTASPFTSRYTVGEVVTVPVAHHDGNYSADPETLKRLVGDDRVAFRYTETPNGSVDDIAGILSANKRVLGMMPHPERRADTQLGGTDGVRFFEGIADALVSA